MADGGSLAPADVDRHRRSSDRVGLGGEVGLAHDVVAKGNLAQERALLGEAPLRAVVDEIFGVGWEQKVV